MIICKKSYAIIAFVFIAFFLVSCKNSTVRPPVVQLVKPWECTQEPMNIDWYFDSTFTLIERQRIKKWLRFNLRSTFAVLGEYPFRMHFYLKKYASAEEPVPWAHTIRDRDQAVKFYLCLHFSDSLLYCDWTAPHEISHLSLPYIGSENSWFAEGYATFMQEQILNEMGFLDGLSLIQKYHSKLDSVMPFFDNSFTMIQNFQNLKKQHNFPAFYWGAVYYFYVIDIKLRIRNLSLNEIIRRYQINCRLRDENFNDLIHSLDSLSESSLFSQELESFHKISAHEIVEAWKRIK